MGLPHNTGISLALWQKSSGKLLFLLLFRIKLVHREMPNSIFGKRAGWIQHVSDLARIQVRLTLLMIIQLLSMNDLSNVSTVLISTIYGLTYFVLALILTNKSWTGWLFWQKAGLPQSSNSRPQPCQSRVSQTVSVLCSGLGLSFAIVRLWVQILVSTPAGGWGKLLIHRL